MDDTLTVHPLCQAQDGGPSWEGSGNRRILQQHLPQCRRVCTPLYGLKAEHPTRRAKNRGQSCKTHACANLFPWFVVSSFLEALLSVSARSHYYGTPRCSAALQQHYEDARLKRSVPSVARPESLLSFLSLDHTPAFPTRLQHHLLFYIINLPPLFRKPAPRRLTFAPLMSSQSLLLRHKHTREAQRS